MTVGLWVWRGVPAARALAQVAVDRRRLGPLPFARLLGTARGFAPRDADPTRWVLLARFPDRAALEAYEQSPVVRGWDARCGGRSRLVLAATSSRGRWAGRQPFAVGSSADPGGPVLAVTRARLRLGHGRRFRAAVPDVAAVPGLRAALGVGEWPVGLLGTMTLWSSQPALQHFVRGHPGHAAVVARTAPERWYAEELYARFAVLQQDGPLT